LGTGTVFDQAIAKFANIYTEQALGDTEALAAAVRSGRVIAEQ
jgi:hypothetical protein